MKDKQFLRSSRDARRRRRRRARRLIKRAAPHRSRSPVYRFPLSFNPSTVHTHTHTHAHRLPHAPPSAMPPYGVQEKVDESRVMDEVRCARDRRERARVRGLAAYYCRRRRRRRQPHAPPPPPPPPSINTTTGPGHAAHAVRAGVLPDRARQVLQGLRDEPRGQPEQRRAEVPGQVYGPVPGRAFLSCVWIGGGGDVGCAAARRRCSARASRRAARHAPLGPPSLTLSLFPPTPDPPRRPNTHTHRQQTW